MKHQFLCDNHRAWLSSEPKRAEHHYLKWVVIANDYVKRGCYKEAIPFWGCAYELSETLLEHNWPELLTSIDRYRTATEGLIIAYYALAEDKLAEAMKLTASKRLAQQLPNRKDYDYISKSIQSLFSSDLKTATHQLSYH